MEAERARMTTYEMRWDGYREISFSLKLEKTNLTRTIDPMPFVPGNLTERSKRCDEILSIQAMGLKNVWSTQTAGPQSLEFRADWILPWRCL